jgi:hypothetical protein
MFNKHIIFATLNAIDVHNSILELKTSTAGPVNGSSVYCITINLKRSRLDIRIYQK